MIIEGNISKMRTNHTDPVRYFLKIGNKEIIMNNLIGQNIELSYSGRINCISCGKRTKTSYYQGFCFKCFQTVPEASETIIRPELSKAHFGIARDMEWANKNDLIDHFVYLAVTNKLKVGVTRSYQIPTRWIDQGADFAIILAKTPNRHIAGIIEVWLKKYISDKTSWKEMLLNKRNENIDLLKEKYNASSLLPSELQKYIEKNNSITKIDYPILNYRENIHSVNFDKKNVISGRLIGIKGQYLIFENNNVCNIRKHNGYYIRFTN